MTFFGINASSISVREWENLTETKLDDIISRGTEILQYWANLLKATWMKMVVMEIFLNKFEISTDMVEMLLLLASIVYERKEENVKNAINKIKEIKKSKGKSITKDIQYIRDQLLIAEESIKDQASKWGLEFTFITELNSLGGPYAGMFWSAEGNFIVLAFKGTTPAHFSEWLTDFLIQKIDARTHLYGQVHEGFYTSLFLKDDNTFSKLYKGSPCLRLIEAIRGKAAEIKKHNRIIKKTDPVSIWITGHSLGEVWLHYFIPDY